jgi:hypothetical protein
MCFIVFRSGTNYQHVSRLYDGLTGDAALVDFGAPLVETSAPELALGMKWANDLVLFGERKFIYPGSLVCLERNGWLYGAPSGHVWWMRVGIDYPYTLPAGSTSMPVQVTVTAQLFGRSGAPVAPVTVLDQTHILSGFHLGDTFMMRDMYVAPWWMRWAVTYVDAANHAWPPIVGYLGPGIANDFIPYSKTSYGAIDAPRNRRTPLSFSKSGDVALVEIGSGVRHWVEEVLRLDVAEPTSGAPPGVALSVAWGIDVCAPLESTYVPSGKFAGLEGTSNPIAGALVRDSGQVSLLYRGTWLNGQISWESHDGDQEITLYNAVTNHTEFISTGPFADDNPGFNYPVAAAWNPRTGESHALLGNFSPMSNAPIPDLRCGYV